MCLSSADPGGPRRCSGDTRAAYYKAFAAVAHLEAVAGTGKPLDTGRTVTHGTWESPQGSLLTQVEKVDTQMLAQMYAEERNLNVADLNDLLFRADARTRQAFQLGYRKPDAAKPGDATGEMNSRAHLNGANPHDPPLRLYPETAARLAAQMQGLGREFDRMCSEKKALLAGRTFGIDSPEYKAVVEHLTVVDPEFADHPAAALAAPPPQATEPLPGAEKSHRAAPGSAIPHSAFTPGLRVAVHGNLSRTGSVVQMRDIQIDPGGTTFLFALVEIDDERAFDQPVYELHLCDTLRYPCATSQL